MAEVRFLVLLGLLLLLDEGEGAVEFGGGGGGAFVAVGFVDRGWELGGELGGRGGVGGWGRVGI